MITEEEKQEIVNLAVERCLVLLPETVGNLITNHMAMSKLNSEFYTKYPEFKDHKDSVAAIMEVVEGENPLLEYKDLLEKAVPKIRERINTVKNMDVDTITSKPNREYTPVITGSNGSPGEL